jgi:uncharacterized membrane protein
MFIVLLYSPNNELHVSAQKSQHQALYKNIKGRNICYHYIRVFSVVSHLNVFISLLLIVFKLLCVIAETILFVQCFCKL